MGATRQVGTTCPSCGTVEVCGTGVTLVMDLEGTTLVGPDSRYEFTCPSCASRIAAPADLRTAVLLLAAGAGVIIPAADPVSHPEAPSAGPALTYDDLLDLHELLDQDGWADEVASSA